MFLYAFSVMMEQVMIAVVMIVIEREIHGTSYRLSKTCFVQILLTKVCGFKKQSLWNFHGESES